METQFLSHNHHNNQQQQQQQQNNNTNNNSSGLLRFRSAPSSLFNEYTHNCGDYESYERKPPRLNTQNGYSSSAQMAAGEQSIHLPPQYPKQSGISTCSSSLERSSSMEINLSTTAAVTRPGNCGLNLNRQNSSPAGFFNHLNNTQNGNFF